MTTAGKRLIAAAREARAIVRGELVVTCDRCGMHWGLQPGDRECPLCGCQWAKGGVRVAELAMGIGGS